MASGAGRPRLRRRHARPGRVDSARQPPRRWLDRAPVPQPLSAAVREGRVARGQSRTARWRLRLDGPVRDARRAGLPKLAVEWRRGDALGGPGWPAVDAASRALVWPEWFSVLAYGSRRLRTGRPDARRR